ncbi:Uncharacterised protein at_DN1832 [Pycnogonum litorale]
MLLTCGRTAHTQTIFWWNAPAECLQIPRLQLCRIQLMLSLETKNLIDLCCVLDTYQPLNTTSLFSLFVIRGYLNKKLGQNTTMQLIILIDSTLEEFFNKKAVVTSTQ